MTEKISSIPIGTPIHARDKCRKASHIHVEKSLHCGNLWCWKILPNAPMVPPPQASPNHIEPIEYINIKPKTFSTSGIVGEFLFQQDTPFTPRH